MQNEHVLFDSPIGALDLEIGPSGLRILEFRDRTWHDRANAGRPGKVRAGTIGKEARGILDRLSAYFDGETEALDGITVAPEGTPYQLRVWAALREVPPGRTVSYRDLAIRIGQPSGMRAVALCNARNPVAIVVPCHRVIGSDGTLVGYGGELDRKQWLLEHEGAWPRRLEGVKAWRATP